MYAPNNKGSVTCKKTVIVFLLYSDVNASILELKSFYSLQDFKYYYAVYSD